MKTTKSTRDVLRSFNTEGDWRTYTPEELGKMLDPPQTARTINLMLMATKLQTPGARGTFVPTAAAKGLFEQDNDGNPRWFPSALARAKKLLDRPPKNGA